jgi:outer membrane protein assembly factor BamA
MILAHLDRNAGPCVPRGLVRLGILLALASTGALAQQSEVAVPADRATEAAGPAPAAAATDFGGGVAPKPDVSAASAAIPSFSELEARGAVIGEILIDNQDIFDLNDPKENNALFRLANKLHINSRDHTLRKSLLFKSGERLSVRLIDETERLMRQNRYLYDVRIEPVAYHDGVVDIKVTTRDTWSLEPGFHFSRQGGANSTGLSLKEYNLFGTGIAAGLSQTSDVDRSGTEFSISDNHAFDGWTTLEYTHGFYDDGYRDAARIDRPFYAMDTRWAAGASVSRNDRLDSIYEQGVIVGQYHHKMDAAQVYAGLSKGLIDGWAHRYSFGLQYQNDAYRPDPSLLTPPVIPDDETLIGPFVRYDIVEDNFAKLKNRNQIERVEYFALGFNSSVTLWRAMTGLGSTRDLWQYDVLVSDGTMYEGGHNLQLSGYAHGRYGSEGGEHQVMGAAGKYYYVQGRYGLFFLSANADMVTNGDATDQLLLGGDNGLRGYPLRYQSGSNRAVFSAEERGYSDWYPFRLFRVGGAIFYDVGRAWEGSPNTANPGWLHDVGLGLRILSDRSAFGNVLHIDLAFPLNREPGIPPYQFSVKSKFSF